MTDEVPERAMLWLDHEVAKWLHELADKDYQGDVQVALNAVLRVLMAADRQPHDPWAATSERLRGRRKS